MRVGYNPNKDQTITPTDFTHQVVIPVYIPNQEGYFKDSFQILQYCLESLFKTCHAQTFITIVNNGSSTDVRDYLNKLLTQNKIHEVSHTHNIGKLNAIFKGVVGHSFPLVTITDADVLFLNNWQMATYKIFKAFPKAGVTGLTPQFKLFENLCGNLLFDNIFSDKLKFTDVTNQAALSFFYDSIGWDKNYNHDYLKKALTLTRGNCRAIVGAGHFVATYKGSLFAKIPARINAKLGKDSERFLDELPLQFGLWRLTTEDNFAFHMGNVEEPWMGEKMKKLHKPSPVNEKIVFESYEKTGLLSYFIKNKLFTKFISVRWMYKLFLKWKKLPKEMIQKY